MARVDRPDGTGPITPVKVDIGGGLDLKLMVDGSGRLYVISRDVEPVDHRGHMVWVDRCQYGQTRYASVLVGVDSAVDSDNNYAYEDGACLSLAAGPLEGDYAALRRGLPELAACTLGLEIRSMYNGWPGGSPAIELRIEYYTGALKYTFGWRYRIHAPLGVDVYYEADWHAVKAVTAMTGTAIWNALKLAVNLDSPAYLRGIMDAQEYDLGDYSVDSEADTTGKGVIVEVRNTALSAADDMFYMGRLLVTDYEPLSSGTMPDSTLIGVIGPVS